MITISPILTLVIIQVAAILYAYVSARHEAPAIISFEQWGFGNWNDYKKQMAVFHRYGNWAKAIFCVVCALSCGPWWLDMLFAGLLSGLWIYLLFDIALNLHRPGVKWYYLGRNDSHGRFWILSFTEETAGKWKALILSASIIITNLLKILL